MTKQLPEAITQEPQSEMVGAFYGDEVHILYKPTGQLIELSDHPNLERILLLVCDGYFRGNKWGENGHSGAKG